VLILAQFITKPFKNNIMKSKFSMLKQALQGGLTVEQIRNKKFAGFNFYKWDFKNWDFSVFDFSSSDFRYSNFRSSDFSSSDFSSSDFSYSNFRSSDFRYSDFRYSDFRYSNFRYSNFRSSDFSSSDFSSSDFRYSNFRYSNFNSTHINENTIGLTLACPEEGSFIAYKKASGYIVKIRVLEHSLRSSATTLKCRASDVEVLKIENIDKTIPCSLTEVKTSYRDSSLVYKVGERIHIADFDTNRWNECSTGIHFFMSRKLAECYN
jgi:hypothetical protein